MVLSQLLLDFFLGTYCVVRCVLADLSRLGQRRICDSLLRLCTVLILNEERKILVLRYQEKGWSLVAVRYYNYL